MDLLLKFIVYIIFIVGSLYFYFGRSNPAEKNNRKNIGIIMFISFLLLSYYYWFEI